MGIVLVQRPMLSVPSICSCRPGGRAVDKDDKQRRVLYKVWHCLSDPQADVATTSC